MVSTTTAPHFCDRPGIPERRIVDVDLEAHLLDNIIRKAVFRVMERITSARSDRFYKFRDLAPSDDIWKLCLRQEEMENGIDDTLALLAGKVGYYLAKRGVDLDTDLDGLVKAVLADAGFCCMERLEEWEAKELETLQA
jgi:hypothetical protein